MIISIDLYKLAYTSLFLIFFLIAFFVIIATRLEELFKKGSIWQIRVAQIIIAVLVAYLLATAIMSLVNSTQF